MPTYEYACLSCKHEWEFEQSIKDNAITECPACHQQTAKRQISRGTGFILKGSGWYADLYSSSSNKPAGDSGGSGSSGGTASATTKTEGGASTPSADKASGGADKPSGGSDKPSGGSPPPSTAAA
jgi:putative FmdB family regulatory protein